MDIAPLGTFGLVGKKRGGGQQPGKKKGPHHARNVGEKKKRTCVKAHLGGTSKEKRLKNCPSSLKMGGKEIAGSKEKLGVWERKEVTKALN